MAAPSGRSSLSAFYFSASLTPHLFSLAGCKRTYSFWLLPLFFLNLFFFPPSLPVFILIVSRVVELSVFPALKRGAAKGGIEVCEGEVGQGITLGSAAPEGSAQGTARINPKGIRFFR